MRINNKQYQTIWVHPENDKIVQIIDQRLLPFEFKIADLTTIEEVYAAIKEMYVRGAPLIGAAAALGMYLKVLKIAPLTDFHDQLEKAGNYLKSSRPTAVNLAYGVDYIIERLSKIDDPKERITKAHEAAIEVVEKEREYCRKIGEYGVKIIEEISRKKNGETVNILTHCNAGWLACIDYGTATAPIYFAHDNGIKVHVWVDETRPRNQGARLTAFELGQHGVPHTVIVDNAGGHLMQHGMVDMVIVGSDRTTANGDVANKIGTYLKALAAHDNIIPFYVALPSSTIDWDLTDGINQIPIEEREPDEVSNIEGLLCNSVEKVYLLPKDTKVSNYGFDVTPARLVTGLITEKGICKAETGSIRALFNK
ncbi:MAG: S-methyl-5-thioribose-1-phosphate isomerase [Bacteroidales bacterium]|nr:S-methyl-5-thioribose-1-phosphate isomerase [Bacteroidales bacterium]